MKNPEQNEPVLERSPCAFGIGIAEDRYSSVLGHGAAAFEAARDGLSQWAMFDLDWISEVSCPHPPRVDEEATLAFHLVGMSWRGTCRITEIIDEDDNYKDILMRWCQARKFDLPDYRTLSHNQGVFVIDVTVNGDVCGVGKARNKKAAEQSAAQMALRELDA